MTNQNHEELESLLFDWDEGALDDDGVARVHEILKTDESARSFFVRQQMVTAALKLQGDTGPEDPGAATEPATAAHEIRTPRRPGLRVSLWAVAVCMLLICALGGRVLFLEFFTAEGSPTLTQQESKTEEEATEETSTGIALVTRLVDIEWAPAQQALEVGDALLPGRLAIHSGYAQVEFFCGATVVLEGPAELDLKSPTLARVVNGRLRAQVPPAARGFSLEVEDMKVVDLGTEFGLSVTPDGADVQVFDGEIELHKPDSQLQRLHSGQAIVRNSEGEFRETPATPDSFIDIAALESRATGQRIVRYERWKKWSDTLRRDPRLVAYYAFDQAEGWNRRLASSLEPANSELDGAIVGAHRVPGRWSTKSGLEFKRPGDRLRVQIPGNFSSLTFCAWVKIDSLDRSFNSLFLTDNYNKGEPHWQILDTGQLYFSVRPNARGSQGPPDFKALSPSFWDPSLSGRWLHLASVYNVDKKSIVHFLNGKILSRHSVSEMQMVPTQMGAATIGNWSSPTMPDAGFAIRNLNGSIDEFAIFSVPLTAEEIHDIYEHGKP